MVVVVLLAAVVIAVVSLYQFCCLMMMMMMMDDFDDAVTEMISDTTDLWRLTFISLQPEDFGIYTCQASNDLDVAVGEITLSRQYCSPLSTLHTAVKMKIVWWTWTTAVCLHQLHDFQNY